MASIKIKDFFNGRFFEIPKYQRGYSWELQNIRDLFDDVVESIESNSNHYIGTIVLSKSENDDEKYFVVDGQQRVTTISLIINALIRGLQEKDRSYYERFYIKEDERYRLTPLNRDQDFFVDLFNNVVGDPENKSQRYLKEASQEISFKVSNIKDKLKFLKSIEKLEIMEFVENSEGDAIRIFQTVNDRGKPLSNMEKAKSLLIYFSNRYLNKKLDNKINDFFSDIFEIYDDLKHSGEELGITLIRNRDFNEDNLMRYHFVSFSNENYDPTAAYVLQFLKNQLTKYRNMSQEGYINIENFIITYITSLKSFFQHCNAVIEKAKSNPKYFKLFVILNLSATLYPVIVKLEELEILDAALPERDEHTFFDIVELIEVRIYKTRATDPKADISRFVFEIGKKTPTQIEGWLIWFNSAWMTKEQFQSNLYGAIFGNRALNHIFVEYCESINGRKFNISDLQNIVSRAPNIEHILAQTPKFSPRALGFKNETDFINHEHTLGNLTLLEKSLNSSIQNKTALEKVEAYGKSVLVMTAELGSIIDTRKAFTKEDLQSRTKEIAAFCQERWWSDKVISRTTPIVTFNDNEWD